MVKLKGNGPLIVVDDNRDALRLAEIIFRDSNIRNEMMFLENQAPLNLYLKKVATGEAQMPCLILLDINMQDCDGVELVRRIRSTDQFRELPIVMLTASNWVNDMERARESGASGYQVKPLEISEYLSFANSLVP